MPRRESANATIRRAASFSSLRGRLASNVTCIVSSTVKRVMTTSPGRPAPPWMASMVRQVHVGVGHVGDVSSPLTEAEGRFRRSRALPLTAADTSGDTTSGRTFPTPLSRDVRNPLPGPTGVIQTGLARLPGPLHLAGGAGRVSSRPAPRAIRRVPPPTHQEDSHEPEPP